MSPFYPLSSHVSLFLTCWGLLRGVYCCFIDKVLNRIPRLARCLSVTSIYRPSITSVNRDRPRITIDMQIYACAKEWMCTRTTFEGMQDQTWLAMLRLGREIECPKSVMRRIGKLQNYNSIEPSSIRSRREFVSNEEKRGSEKCYAMVDNVAGRLAS